MTAAQTLTLTDFLLARIAEDEAEQGDGSQSWEHWHTGGCGEVGAAAGMNYCDCEARSRVLAECEAKRRIVEDFEDAQHTIGGLEEEGDYEAATGWVDNLQALERTLRVLAAIYADHPDYRQEWRA